ncbi:MAG: serine/threonine-protein kinase [Acidobacteria bacterium]|nr:serine/threonine-protein kinase [Acidobacteriota bacterium]
MSLLSGTRLGPYEILAPLGAGGMGEVYKARDTRLDRIVAIKVLAPELAADPEFRQRFDREARAISQLTHPNICTLHDVGEAVVGRQSSVVSRQSATSHQPPDTSGVTVQFLVMELLDGVTLADRLGRVGRVISDPPPRRALSDVGRVLPPSLGASADRRSLGGGGSDPPASAGSKGPGLQVSEALTIAIQIGEALAAAHRAGLVHRDLKPGNVMLTKTGAKLLDFGLAKASSVGPTKVGPYVGAELAPPMTAMPTTPAAMTAQGAIVGTFQYMAPEQIEGHDADARSDIFAFGCVLYEMLAGRKAFEGKSHASLIGAIMHAEPPSLTLLTTPSPLATASLDRVVRKCLAKDPDARWQSARDLVDELKWIAEDGASATVSAAPVVAASVKAARPWLGWAIAGVATLAAAALGAIALTRSPAVPSAPRTRFTITMPEGVALTPSPGALSVSPDGTRIVFAAINRNDLKQLWLRPLDATEASPIPHTEGAFWAFWSPDGRWIGYYNVTTSQLMKTDAIGGQPQVICNATTPQGASWSGDGVIVFGSPLGVYRVPAAGGTPVAVTKVGPGEGSHQGPSFLPDGRHFLFTVFGVGMFVGTVDGSAPREVEHGLTGGHRLVGDELLTVRRGAELVSQHLDTRRMTLTAEPTAVGVADASTYVASASTLAPPGGPPARPGRQ